MSPDFTIKTDPIRSLIRILWYLLLLSIGICIIFLILKERKNEKECSHEYLLENNAYVKPNSSSGKIDNPTIFNIELAEIKANHDNVAIEGSLSLSFYNPGDVFPKSSGNESEKIIKVEMQNFRERKKDRTIHGKIKCGIKTKDAKTYASGYKDTVFVPVEGYVFDYPFDHLKFSVFFNFQPHFEFDEINFDNGVPGMFFETRPTIAKINSGLLITFDMIRKDSIQIAYWIILISIASYIVLIVFFVKKLSSLVSAVGGFFISVWSVRSLFSQGALVYPNLVDLTVIFASIILLIGILDRIIFGKYIKDE